MVDCDIHPMCRDQGCIADPNHCQRAQDIRAIRVGNASAAARARDNQFEANKPRMTSNQREGSPHECLSGTSRARAHDSHSHVVHLGGDHLGHRHSGRTR
jgi:hypothetical protein